MASESEIARERLRVDLPPLPSLDRLTRLRSAGLFDPRSIYSSETVHQLSHLTLSSIERQLAWKR